MRKNIHPNADTGQRRAEHSNHPRALATVRAMPQKMKGRYIMKHYKYTIDNEFRLHEVIATSADEAKKIIKEVTGVPMKYQVIVGKELTDENWYISHARYIGYRWN